MRCAGVTVVVALVLAIPGARAEAPPDSDPPATPPASAEGEAGIPPFDDSAVDLLYFGGPVPSGYRVSWTVLTKVLVIAGSAMLAGGYLVSVIAGAQASAHASPYNPEDPSKLYIPIVGPLLWLSTHRSGGAYANIGALYVGGAVVVDSLAQMAGAVLLLGNLLFPQRRITRDTPASNDTRARITIGANRIALEGRF